jgi:hypothetical protein
VREFNEPLRVAVVGSRSLTSYATVREYIDKLHPGCTVVSGGARGVDHVAETAARARGLEVLVFVPDWHRHGRSAGIIRNRKIVEACDVVSAFWDGSSRGTKSTIDIAKSLGKPVKVVQEPWRFEPESDLGAGHDNT